MPVRPAARADQAAAALQNVQGAPGDAAALAAGGAAPPLGQTSPTASPMATMPQPAPEAMAATSEAAPQAKAAPQAMPMPMPWPLPPSGPQSLVVLRQVCSLCASHSE